MTIDLTHYRTDYQLARRVIGYMKVGYVFNLNKLDPNVIRLIQQLLEEEPSGEVQHPVREYR